MKGDPGTIRCKNTRKIRWEALKEKRRNRAIIKERFMFSWQVLSGCSDFWDGKGNITPLSEEDRKALHELCAKWAAEDLDVVRVCVRASSLRTTDFGFSFFSLSCRFTLAMRTLKLIPRYSFVALQVAFAFTPVPFTAEETLRTVPHTDIYLVPPAQPSVVAQPIVAQPSAAAAAAPQAASAAAASAAAPAAPAATAAIPAAAGRASAAAPSVPAAPAAPTAPSGAPGPAPTAPTAPTASADVPGLAWELMNEQVLVGLVASRVPLRPHVQVGTLTCEWRKGKRAPLQS